MALVKSKGNMYNFCTHIFNPVSGKCMFNCSYCYMKRFPQKEIRFKPKELQIDPGINKTIFICSGTDLFAPNIPTDWIMAIAEWTNKYDNQYFLQSKNPMRMSYFYDTFPKNTIYCVTIESDRDYSEISKAPIMGYRRMGLTLLKNAGCRIMVTIEPIMDFDVLELSSMLISLHPEQINIGADSKRSNLPEPSEAKILKLIENLERQNIVVHKKKNLKRLVKSVDFDKQ